jgi:glycosyltransferase involved in cell wall biosynthesis
MDRRASKLIYLSAISEPRGGAEEYMLALMRHIDQERWDLSVGLPKRDVTQSLVRDFRGVGARVHYVEMGAYLHGRKASQRSILKNVLWFLLKFRPDLVHINISYPTEMRMPMLAAALLNVPTVATFHLAPAVLESSSRVQSLYRWMRYRHTFWITVSYFNRRNLVEMLGLDEDLIEVVYNGVNQGRFSPNRRSKEIREQVRAEFGLPETAKLITTVARFHRQKGYEYLAEAVPRILRQHPGSYLVWVGVGELQAALRQQVNQLGVADHVIFAGYRIDVPVLLAATDVFVLPTLYEGHPFSLAEAMMMGLPCVASRVSGIAEILQDGEQGLLVEPKASKALAQAICHLLDNPELCEQLGQRARKRSLELSEENMAERTAELYEKALISKSEANRPCPIHCS